MGGFPQVGVFNRQRPIQCARCGHTGTRHPTKFGCVTPCPHDVQPPQNGAPPPGTPPAGPGDFTARPGGPPPPNSGIPLPVPATQNNQGPGAMAAHSNPNNGNGNGWCDSCTPTAAHSWLTLAR